MNVVNYLSFITFTFAVSGAKLAVNGQNELISMIIFTPCRMICNEITFKSFIIMTLGETNALPNVSRTDTLSEYSKWRRHG